jgi:pyrroline-5-carboxylate reductase
VLLAVKPQQMKDVLSSLAVKPGAGAGVRADATVISIAAGIRTARLDEWLGGRGRIVRVMPNTPMLVGLGASGLCPGSSAREEDLAVVEALFGVSSVTVRVPEPLLDAVTGLSGSGPAYLFYLAEAMIEAGVAEGFSREQAARLTARTLLGAAKMLEDTGLPPEELRRRVTSPNGTTQAAIERLEADGVKAKITAAVRRAAERSRELGRRT